jgi:WD40 repeat protein
VSQRIRIFISSPSDVYAVREIAALTIERLAQDFARFFEIEPYLWEYEAMIASGHFQDSIEPPSSFDIVLLILWSRLGTTLPGRTQVREYRGLDGRAAVTGTEWEFEDALGAAQRCGKPDLLVYRSMQQATFDIRDPQRRQEQLQQLAALEKFWARHFADQGRFLGAYVAFTSDAEFAAALEQHLRKLIEKRIAAQAPGQRGESAKAWMQAPFRGLEAYEFEHAPIYFGQDEALTKAMLQLSARAEAGSPFLLLLGASGSGKSSLAKAGIVPKLFVPRRIAGAAFLRRVVFRPSDAREGEDLIDALARRLTSQLGEREGLAELVGPGQTLAGLAAHLRNATAEPAYPIGAALGQLTLQARQAGRMLDYETARLVLVVDQLEELFTNEQLSTAERRRFIALLDGLVRSGLVWIVATMRKDYWHCADETPDLVRMAEGSGRLELLPPAPSQLSQMIRRPAEAAGINFELHPTTGVALNEVIADEVAREPGALPLLSYLMDQLYRADVLEAGGSTLTYATYVRLGKLEGAIATKAEAVLQSCAPLDREALGSVLFLLVQAGTSEGSVDRAVARRVPLSNFPAETPQRRLVEALLDRSARLLVSDADDGKAPTIRVAHEALISRWARAREFVQSNAAVLSIRRRIEERHGRWRDLESRGHEAGREPQRRAGWRAHFGRERGLLSDIDLADGQRLLLEHRQNTEPELIAYIERSVAQETRVRTRLIRALAAIASVVTLLAVLASAASWIASRRQHEAEEQTAQALRAQSQLLTEAAAERLMGGDVAGAQGVILEVVTSTDAARAHAPAAVSVFQEVRAQDALIEVLPEHEEVLESASYSPDGSRIVTASRDLTARIWDARSGAPLAILKGHGGWVMSAAYSPDGARIVSASADKTARIWDARSGAQLAVLRGHGDVVESAAFSPDGTRIVTASADKTARIWDAGSAAQLAVLGGHTGVVQSAAYSPDGSRIVTASADTSTRIWDAHSGKLLTTLSGHGDTVWTAVYSRDGGRIVTASADKSARIWDAHSGAQLAVLTGHGGWVRSAAFSADGTRVVTASYDRTVRLWDARLGTSLEVLYGHGGWVMTAAFSPDGSRLVSASFDKTARIWQAHPVAQLGVLSGHSDRVQSGAYSPDGTRIVTASYDRTARIWDARSFAQLAVLTGHTDRVQSAAFSPDGTRIVTASIDRSARVWDAHSAASLLVLKGHQDIVESAAYSPDGTRIVTASFDRTARIWDASSGAQLTVLAGHGGWVLSAAYSPDGTRIVTASLDRTARVWDARTGAQLGVLTGHGAWLRMAAYSRDGTRIVTASKDTTARLWDAHSFAQLGVLSGHEDIVESATFSPDGAQLLTASDDMTARIWDAHSYAQLQVLAGHGGVIRRAAYSPDGSRAITASDDLTARIWDATVPGGLDAQILWQQAAQIDPLAQVKRAQLGLAPDPRRRLWPGSATACDQAAAAYYDPDRTAPGIAQAQIAADVASAACVQELAATPNSARLAYQAGRALLANRDFKGAKSDFERALSQGYRSAGLDLGDLLLEPGAGVTDPARATTLYTQAWEAGVPIAASRLGQLYESGTHAAQAWAWYQKGADAGEPASLARLAVRAEADAASESTAAKGNALLLQAFTSYAAAAEAASAEAWPDASWLNWRYHRATLARVLAQAGMMQSVADAYQKVRAAASAPQHTWLQRLTARLAGH